MGRHAGGPGAVSGRGAALRPVRRWPRIGSVAIVPNGRFPPAVESRIILVRHGPSSHTESPGWIDAAGVSRWREAYDAAGILPESEPPTALVALTARAGCVIASDLPRATASAERIAGGTAVRVTPLLRETPLEVPRWLPARWPLGVWGVCISVHWLLRERRGQIAAPAELERTAQAAALLDDVAREATTVVAVTHGA